MILVLSPAKALDFETPPTTDIHTQSDYLPEAEKLVGILRRMSPAQIAKLMSLSDKLAALNAARYEAWSRPFSSANAKQAVLAFDGDVYDGLDASSLDREALIWAQDHLRILSGLYGLLRPLDLVQPYRLEMGSKLANPNGSNLYAYWGEKLTEGLNRVLDAGRERGAQAVLVNLASAEYFKSIKPGGLRARVVVPVFEDWKSGGYKVISFYAKRARGLMARYAIENRIENCEDLKEFDSAGYRFVPDISDAERFVFRRRLD